MAKGFCLAGAVLLATLAALHATGFGVITERMADTDAGAGLKKMVPVLYLNTSFNLALFAGLSLAAAFNPAARRPIGTVLALMAFANAGLAAYFGEPVATGILGAATLLFTTIALRPET
ncbi:MAG: hypothetical protein AAFQ21_13760 [Pseudomonadota bacterium]